MAMITLEPTLLSHQEMDGSPTESQDQYGPRIQRKLLCAWADRWTLIAQLLGHTEGGIYYLAHKCPYHSSLRAQSIGGISGWGERTQQAGATYVYEFAEIDVDYRRATTDPASGDSADPNMTYISESIEGAAEFITLPNQKLYWDDDAVAQLGTSEAPAMLLKTINWVYTIHRLATIPEEFLSYVGGINSAAITSITLNRTFAARTLLYNPPQFSRDITSEGVQAWQATLRFTERKKEWNKFPKTDELDADGMIKFAPIYNAAGTQVKLYPELAFGNLVYQPA